MTKSKSIKTTKVPFYYMDDYYFYGDPDEPRIEKEKWYFKSLEKHWRSISDFTDILLEIYQVACFISFFINLIHLLILTRKELRSNIIFIVMTGVCICDIFQSLGKIAQLVMTWDIIYKIETCDDGLKYSHQMANLVSKTIQIMNRQCSGFLVFYIAAFRAFSVVFPMSNLGTRMMKPITGFYVVSMAGIVSGAWSLVYFFKANYEEIIYCVDYIKLPSYVPWRFIKYERWEAVYLFIDSLIAVTVSVLYILVTIVLVIALVMNKKRSKKLNKEQKSTNTSAMIISMAITVFLSELSYGVMYFTNLLLFQGFEEQRFFEDMTSGVFTLLIFNSIFHVVICFFMSSQYRDTVRSLVCRKVPEKQKMATVLENTLVSTASKGSNSSRRTF